MTHKLTTLALALGLAVASAFAAHAAPTLTADPYPPLGVQPDTAVITSGSQTIQCTLPRAANGSVTPTCDLGSLPATGTFSLTLTVTKSASCTVSGGVTTCVGGGSASSTPFALVRQSGLALAPVNLSVAP